MLVPALKGPAPLEHHPARVVSLVAGPSVGLLSVDASGLVVDWF